MSFGVLKFNVIFSCVNSSLKVLILRQTRKYAKYLWAKRFVTVGPTNFELFGHIGILIEIPAEKNGSTILGQRGGALAVLANDEDS